MRTARTIRGGLVCLAIGPPIAHDGRPAKVRANIPRACNVDRHSARGQFRPQCFRITLHGKLRGRVARSVGRPHFTHYQITSDAPYHSSIFQLHCKLLTFALHRTDPHDPPAAVLDHPRHRRLGQRRPLRQKRYLACIAVILAVKFSRGLIRHFQMALQTLTWVAMEKTVLKLIWGKT